MGLPRLNWSDHCARHLTTSGRAQYKPFAMPGDKSHFTRDKRYNVHHMRLEVELDLLRKRVSGTSFLTVSPVLDGLASLEVDAAELVIKAARLDSGEKLAFEVGDKTVKVKLPTPVKAGQRVTIAIDYEAAPRKGLYFVAPDEAYPKKPLQVWSQGEDMDNRYWFPCYDFPNQRATTEIIATVPESMFALSNGVLANVRHDPAKKAKTYHWKQEQPHVTYLVTLAVGEFAEVTDRYDGVPIQYYVPKGREEDARRSLGNTPDMMRVFTELLKVPYPWAKYAQVAVADFIFGGMENTTATTLTDMTLHDARAHIDFSSDPLVAHELAHQWFGDLLTCKDWSHAWLNEGFATYFEALYTEKHLGQDEFRYEMYQNAGIYFTEATGRYKRPIVTRLYSEPIDIFDRHLYEKGSLVLHMLRHELGDELFFGSLNHYVKKHHNGVVDTEDLRGAIEEVTGKTMEAFFDQWLYKAGHPEMKVSYSWDDETKMAKVTISQNQDEKEISVFSFPVTLDFKVDGAYRSFKVDVSEKEHRFHFPLGAKPTMFRFDPGNSILKTLEEDLPKDIHLQRLKEDDDVIGRIRSAQALGKLATRDCIDALKATVMTDRFWGVQSEAARALGTVKSKPAQDTLIECLAVKHPKARRAVVTALGNSKDEAVGAALAKLLAEGDESYFVEAEAGRSLGKTKAKIAFDGLVKGLERDSINDVVRSAVMDGLAELKDERGLEIAKEWCKYGRSQPVRSFAIWAVSRLGEERKDTVEFLAEYLYDPWLRVRLRAIDALEGLGDWKAIGPLSILTDREMDGRVKRRAKEAIASIREGAKSKEEVVRLREDLDKVHEHNKTLMDRLDRLEAKVK